MVDSEPEKLGLSRSETAELVEIMASADAFCSSGYVTFKDMTKEKLALLVKAFEKIGAESSALFRSKEIAKKMRSSAAACRNRFKEFYLRKYLSEP